MAILWVLKTNMVLKIVV